MGFRTKNGNREQMLLLPPSLDDWVREDDIVRFYVETVKSLNIPLEKFHLNWRGTGDAMYDPYAMLTLVLYSFSEKRFSTRAMEKACWNDIPSRYIMGNQFPDHTTIARFIQKNTSAPEKVVADRGYFSEENHRELDKRGIDATIPNHMKHPEDGGKVYETLSSPYLIAKSRQARSKEGQASLQRRKTTAEPMFGLMKWCLGFRDFLRRGLANVTKEFLILIATINIKRLHTLLAVEG